MTITYNNLQGANNLITFSDIPNILKITDDAGGTRGSITLTIQTMLKTYTTGDTQWWITIMGETITNTLLPSNAVNRNFYISNSPADTAAYMVRALRNCPTVSTNYIITNSSNTVTLTAKKVGKLYASPNEILDTNIAPAFMGRTYTDGTAYSPLYGSIVLADIYSDGNYITTLEKNFYDGETAFNLSPVLASISVLGNAVPYSVTLSSLKDGVYSQLGTISTNYASVGYMVNQGQKYLDNSYMNIAQNFSRGISRDSENNTILYIYKPEIDISIYKGGLSSQPVTIDYLDSAYNLLYTENTSWSNSDASKKLLDLHYNLNTSLFNQSFYIDITIGSKKVRYNVIKPLMMTEYCQRIYWRNSYGGISFIDLTGQKSETRDFEISTYQKSIYDYYVDPMNELDKVYDNDVKYVVTLKSHLFENDGKYIYNDLIQSPEVWTEVNDEKYAIILQSVSVDEVDSNNIYEATVRYTYSMHPSLI